MPTYTIYAEDGEYSETAENISRALTQFQVRRPDLFVCAITDNHMQPSLILSENLISEETSRYGLPASKARVYERWLADQPTAGLRAVLADADTNPDSGMLADERDFIQSVINGRNSPDCS